MRISGLNSFSFSRQYSSNASSEQNSKSMSNTDIDDVPNSVV